jgi:TRAP-type C4-dicarboxylate transport system permease large subunit
VLLFVVANMTRAPMVAIVRDLVPYLIWLIAALFAMTYLPDMVLWLPRVFGYTG